MNCQMPPPSFPRQLISNSSVYVTITIFLLYSESQDSGEKLLFWPINRLPFSASVKHIVLLSYSDQLEDCGCFVGFGVPKLTSSTCIVGLYWRDSSERRPTIGRHSMNVRSRTIPCFSPFLMHCRYLNEWRTCKLNKKHISGNSWKPFFLSWDRTDI